MKTNNSWLGFIGLCLFTVGCDRVEITNQQDLIFTRGGGLPILVTGSCSMVSPDITVNIKQNGSIKASQKVNCVNKRFEANLSAANLAKGFYSIELLWLIGPYGTRSLMSRQFLYQRDAATPKRLIVSSDDGNLRNLRDPILHGVVPSVSSYRIEPNGFAEESRIGDWVGNFLGGLFGSPFEAVGSGGGYLRGYRAGAASSVPLVTAGDFRFGGGMVRPDNGDFVVTTITEGRTPDGNEEFQHHLRIFSKEGQQRAAYSLLKTDFWGYYYDVCVDPVGQAAWVWQGYGKKISVLSLNTGLVIKELPTLGKIDKLHCGYDGAAGASSVYALQTRDLEDDRSETMLTRYDAKAMKQTRQVVLNQSSNPDFFDGIFLDFAALDQVIYVFYIAGARPGNTASDTLSSFVQKFDPGGSTVGVPMILSQNMSIVEDIPLIAPLSDEVQVSLDGEIFIADPYGEKLHSFRDVGAQGIVENRPALSVPGIKNISLRE